MKLQLTISLLVSNQLQSIRRCLDSLVPILMQIPSELIVVDTSENEQVHKLVSQYTSQVIPFHWCNDFSKARNIGLKNAQGEWFMYIDDDEWLEDVNEIVNFFTSGEYHYYKSATYIVRNYTEWNGINYIDAHLNRMVRCTPEVKFVDSIHEYITPFTPPVKTFSAYAHHYGYVNNIINTKSDRNIPMLKKELKNRTPTSHIYQQLAQEYMTDFQYSKAEEYALKCLEIKANNAMVSNQSWCVAFMTYLILQQKEYDRAFEVGKKMLRNPFCTEIAALRVYADLITTCDHLEHKEKNIITYAKAYHDTIERLDARPEQWFIQSIGRLGEQQSKLIKYNIYLFGLKAAILIEDQKSALTFLQWFPWKTQEIEKFYETFSKFISDKTRTNFLLDRFCELDNDNPFITINKAKAAWRNNNLESAKNYYHLSLRSDNTHVLRESVLLSLQSEDQIPLQSLLESIDINQWLYISTYVSDKAELNQLPNWITIAKTYLNSYPVQALLLLISFQERLLMEGILQIDDEEIFQEVKNYCEWVIEYYSTIYNERLLSPESIYLMPKNFQFALLMRNIFDYLKKFNYPEVLQGLRQAIEIYQPLCGIVRRMLSVIEEDMKQPSENREEFEMLGTQVKAMVQNLIQQNRYEEALPLVQQLSSLLPRDLEVLRLRQELWSHNGE